LQDLYVQLDNEYLNQPEGTGLQQGGARQKMLGIDTHGIPIEAEDKMILETNLEEILIRFYATALKTSMFNNTLCITNSLQLMLISQKTNNSKDTEKLNQYVTEWIKLVVLNQYNDEGQGAKTLDSVRKLTNFTTFALSPTMVIQESLQGAFAKQSLMVSQFMGKMFGQEMEIDRISSMKAKKYLGGVSEEATAKGEFMNNMYGLWKASPKTMTMNDEKSTKGNYLFQSSKFFWFGTLPGKYYRKDYFFSKFTKEGIMENALVYDKTTKQVRYDYTKDPRFEGLFDESGNIKNNLSPEFKNKLEHYKFLQKELAVELDGLDENGHITRPYTNTDIITLKDRVGRVYGSMETDNEVTLNLSVIGRMFSTFKGWLPLKIDKYWTARTAMSMRKKMVKIPNPINPDGFPEDFIYDYEPEMGEGILQTLYFIGNEIYQETKKGQFKQSLKVFSNLESDRQENLKKLMGDLITLLMGIILVSVLSNVKAFQTKNGKMLLASVTNSLNDLNIIKNTDYMFGNNPFAVYKFAKKSISNTAHVFMYSAHGDFEEAGKSAANLTNFSRTTVELFTEE